MYLKNVLKKNVKISPSLFSCAPTRSVWKTHGVYTSAKNTWGRYTHTFCLVSASSTSHYMRTNLFENEGM